MVFRVNHKLKPNRVPTRKGARCLTHIAFVVVAHSQRKQLHDFPGEIFIGGVFHIGARIKELQHRRILRNSREQNTKFPQALGLKKFDLLEHLAVITHLVFVGSKVPVPEECQLFPQRRSRQEHSLRPPISHSIGFQTTRTQPVKKLVHHRLNRPITSRFNINTKGRTRFFGKPRCRWPARREWIEARIKHTGVLKRPIRG